MSKRQYGPPAEKTGDYETDSKPVAKQRKNDDEIGIMWTKTKEDRTYATGVLKADELFKWLGENGVGITAPDKLPDLRIVMFPIDSETKNAPNWRLCKSIYTDDKNK